MELLHDLNTHHKNSFSLSRHRHKGYLPAYDIKGQQFLLGIIILKCLRHNNNQICNNAVLTSTMHLYLFPWCGSEVLMLF